MLDKLNAKYDAVYSMKTVLITAIRAGPDAFPACCTVYPDFPTELVGYI